MHGLATPDEHVEHVEHTELEVTVVGVLAYVDPLRHGIAVPPQTRLEVHVGATVS